MFPVFYDLRPPWEMKMEKISRDLWSLLGTRRTLGTCSDYQEVAAFPVINAIWEPGNNHADQVAGGMNIR
jgi:hypothetical protein